MSRSTPSLVIIFAFLAVPAGALPSQTGPATAPATQPAASAPALAQPGEAVARMRQEAEAIQSLVTTDLARRFLAAVPELPPITPRVIYRHPTTRQYMTAASFEAHKADFGQAPPRAIDIDEARYYDTKYGTPLAYCRALDLLGQHGFADLKAKKILDFGYGTVGHLRLMALCGAHALGVDVDSFLPAIYSEPSDQGPVTSIAGVTGSITLLDGRFPADSAIQQAAGTGYDLFISKNTLKHGYIHPPADANVDPRQLIDLGVSDAVYVKAVFDALEPGGLMMIYNICPAPAAPGKPYIPWADGLCPFERSLIEQAGFKVIAFDQDDSAAARAQGHALGWDQGDGAMDLEHDLFAHCTLLQKPSA